MRIFTAVIVSLITIFLTAAQGAGSPEELAKEVQMLIETNQTENIDKLLKDAKVMSYFCHSGLSGIFPQKDSRQAGSDRLRVIA